MKDSRELAALQWRMIRSDSREAGKEAGKVTLLFLVAFVLMMSATPVVLAGIALSLVLAGFPLWSGFLLVGMLGVGIALWVGWLGYRSASKTMATFDTSMEEWNKNVDWIKKRFHQ